MKIEKQSSKTIRPLIPTPPTLRRYTLGLTDEIAPYVDIGVVLFYSANKNPNPKYVATLEKSLEETLTRFYPLAGRYIEEIQTIECNDEGVEFMHAKANIKLEDILGFGSEVNAKLVDEFIPSKNGPRKIDDPLLSIQVTTLECGGVALGVSISHKIVDASTLCTFLNEWATTNREETEAELTGRSGFNSSLFPSRGFRSLPVQYESKYIRKKLSFSEREISNMRTKAITNCKNSTQHWSKVQLVSAIIWKAFIGLDQEIHNYSSESLLLQAINLRERMASLIPKNYCGNLCGMCTTKSGTDETTFELVDLLTDSIKKTIENFSKVEHSSEEAQTMVVNPLFSTIPNTEVTNVIAISSWCNFPFYEVDFGFGKPTWIAPGSQPAKHFAHLMDDAAGRGVEAYIYLDVKDVPYFVSHLDVNVFAT